MKYSCDDYPTCSIDVIDSLAQDVFELYGKDELDVAISKHVEKEYDALMFCVELQKLLQNWIMLRCCSIQVPSPNLKLISNHLKSVFLRDNETLPVNELELRDPS
ncbi:hypothetical protein PTKIN_Ptkin15bG0060300 [Pterospermum kingtungense]